MDHQEQALRSHISGAVGSLVLDGQTDAEILLRRSVQATFEFFEGDRSAVILLFRDPLLLGDRFALRRAHTDDDLTAAELADFAITMIFDGLRPRPDHHRSA